MTVHELRKILSRLDSEDGDKKIDAHWTQIGIGLSLSVDISFDAAMRVIEYKH